MKDLFRKENLLLAIALVSILYVTFSNYIRTNYPVCIFRYKLSAEINTPDGLKSGSSVFEVSYSHGGDWGGGKSAILTVTGDAVYTNLGGEKNLFITLTRASSGRIDPHGFGDRNYSSREGSSNIFGLPLRVFNLNWELGHEVKLCMEISQLQFGKKYDVPLSWLPTLVTFGNLKDPNSVQVVQPNSLDTSIGAGFSFKNANLEISNEPISQPIDQALPWLPELKEKSTANQTHKANEPLIDSLNYDAFRGPGLDGDGGSAL
jgi:hypothetical protein